MLAEAAELHSSEPPATVGSDGAVRSMRAVPCTQVEALPAPSTARKRTRVSPSADTTAEAPVVGDDDQVVPPSVEVSYSMWARPEPPASDEPEAPSVTDATFCQAAELPLRLGAVGAVRSSRTVALTQAEARPATSMARTRTSVSPSAVTARDGPADGADHVEP